jgi:hypothetical protein
MTEAEILTRAQRLLVKYFHPSQHGTVPDPDLAARLGDAGTLLKLAAVRAKAREETT